MASEYDPVFARPHEVAPGGDLEPVQDHFANAANPYLASPVPWLLWGLALPFAALATRPVLAAAGPRGVLLLWSLTILAAGAVEAAVHARRGRRRTTPLARWVLRAQANLSLALAALSAALLWAGQTRLLAGLWLLLLGHSLYALGGLARRALRSCGLIYQLGGLVALFATASSDMVFALTTGIGNLWVAGSILRARRQGR